MKIAIDASILESPEPTGVERAALELVRAMAEQRAVRLVLYGRSGQPPFAGAAADGVAWRGLGSAARIAVWRESRLAPALSRDGIDALWSPVAAIPLRTRVPVVATVHEVPWLVRPAMEGRVRGGVHALRLRIAAARAARIVCPSEATRKQVLRAHPAAAGRVRVVPHGVHARFRAARDGLPRETPRGEASAVEGAVPGAYWLHVGGARARKNLPMLFAAFVRYRESGGDAELRLVGPGTAPAHVPRGVSWHGYVAEETLLAMYAGARGMVVSSESEGFGLPVLEAMAAGCPVVACAAGGVPEAAGDAAVLVPPGGGDAQAEALTAAMRSLDTDPSRRRGLVEAGRRRAAEATWSRAAQQLLEVLAEVREERR